MAITTAFTKKAKQSFLKGVHRSGDAYKMAFYSSAATLNSDTAAYSATNEVTNSPNCVAGGVALSGITFGDGAQDTAYIDWDNVSFAVTGAFTARGCMVYNTSSGTNGGAANEAIAVIDFGADITATDSTFTVTIPSSGAGLIRFA